jgi:hypothetical protein
MKITLRNILVASAMCLLCSCTVYYQMGQSEYEFVNSNRGKGLQVEEQSPYRTVYKSCNGYGSACTFFYFYNNKLVRVDRGVREPDIIIENY